MSVILDRESIINTIALLQRKQSIEIDSFKNEWESLLSILNMGSSSQNGIFPSNNKVSSSNHFINNIIGLSTGFLINKIYPKKPGGLFAKISKLSFEFLAGKFVASHYNQILSISFNVLKSILSEKHKSHLPS